MLLEIALNAGSVVLPCVRPGYAQRGVATSVAKRQDAAVPSGRAFQHYTAGVKRDFQQHATQHM